MESSCGGRRSSSTSSAARRPSGSGVCGERRSSPTSTRRSSRECFRTNNDWSDAEMPRVKRGTVRRAKRKKLLGLAKGYYANKSKLYRAAKESVDTALKYAFVGRRRKKRDFRRLWIVRINAA